LQRQILITQCAAVRNNSSNCNTTSKQTSKLENWKTAFSRSFAVDAAFVAAFAWAIKKCTRKIKCYSNYKKK